MSNEGPFIHRSDSLPKQIDHAVKTDPRQIVPAIIAAIQDRRIKFASDQFNGYRLNRRTLLKAGAGAGLAMAIPQSNSYKELFYPIPNFDEATNPANFADPSQIQRLNSNLYMTAMEQADDGGLYTNDVPWSSPDYFPIDINVAHKKGLQTLDEIGGPLHVLSLAHEMVNGTPKSLHLWWKEEVTDRYIALNYKYNGGAGLGDAGYCPELAAAQIHKPNPSYGVWRPDLNLSNKPNFKASNPDYGIGRTAITGMYVALMAGGVVYMPNETKDKNFYGPSGPVRNNLNQFFYDFQAMPPGSDRLPIIESPVNWHRAVREFSADGRYILAENFGQPQVWVPTSSVVWVQKRLSYKTAKMLQETGQMQFSREAMNQNAMLRNPDLDENFIDYLAGNQLAYS